MTDSRLCRQKGWRCVHQAPCVSRDYSAGVEDLLVRYGTAVDHLHLFQLQVALGLVAQLEVAAHDPVELLLADALFSRDEVQHVFGIRLAHHCDCEDVDRLVRTQRVLSVVVVHVLVRYRKGDAVCLVQYRVFEVNLLVSAELRADRLFQGLERLDLHSCDGHLALVRESHHVLGARVELHAAHLDHAFPFDDQLAVFLFELPVVDLIRSQHARLHYPRDHRTQGVLLVEVALRTLEDGRTGGEAVQHQGLEVLRVLRRLFALPTAKLLEVHFSADSYRARACVHLAVSLDYRPQTIEAWLLYSS